MDIHQGGDCYGMWLILRLEGLRQMLEQSTSSEGIFLSYITSLVKGGGKNNKLGVRGRSPHGTVRYIEGIRVFL